MIDEFISEFLTDRPIYEEWGKFVASEILKGIPLGQESKDQLLKIPVKIRVKKEASIRAKIARYSLTNPRDEILDLVGIRFVVLLTSDLSLIESAVQQSDVWRAEKSRDFLAQRNDNPELFDYQSIHYSVTAKANVNTGGVTVRSGTTCEVQIRTLLQHAYAELTHDNLYKPIHLVPQSAKRFVARSMALMETTDDLFCRTLEELQAANQPRNELYRSLRVVFAELLPIDPERFDERTNLDIIETFCYLFDYSTVASQVTAFWVENSALLPTLQSRLDRFLYTQPVILLLYWLAYTNDHAVKSDWRYDSLIEELRFIFSDLGIAIGDQL